MTTKEKAKSISAWDSFYESNADFKARITAMMREKETGKKFSIVGASRASNSENRKVR